MDARAGRPPSSSGTPASELKPVLGLFDVTMIVMGCIIGAGCFGTPSIIAQKMGSTGGILAVWAIGGVIALTGALVFAELAAMFPRTGGQYVFVKESFGRFPAFMFGWLLLAAIVSNAIAWVARIFASHLEIVLRHFDPDASLAPLGAPFAAALGWIARRPLPAGEAGEKVVALLLIVGFTLLNIRGLKLGAAVQNAAMVAKIAGILTVIALGVVVVARGDAVPQTAVPATTNAGRDALFAAFNAALFKAMFTYGGWQNVAAVGSEVKEPRRTLPLGILVGTVAVVALYLALNGALLAILGPAGVAATATPTATAAGRVIAGGEVFVAALVMISTFAITQALLMVTPRIYFAMANDGLFFRSVGTVHPRFRTPAIAIALQGLATVVHLLLGDVLDLLDMATFFDWLGFTLCAVALFVLRAKRPDAPRPYRAFGYPWLPGLFLLLSTWVFVFHFVYAEPLAKERGAWVFAVGLVLYAAFRRGRGKLEDRRTTPIPASE